jgi:hypothetical protein
MAARRKEHPDVARITSAPQSPQAEMAHRQKRYIISMSIRTACFVAAILVGSGWLRWVLVAAAFVLPYVAVVMANSASPRIEGTDPFGPDVSHPELGTGPSPERSTGPVGPEPSQDNRGTI